MQDSDLRTALQDHPWLGRSQKLYNALDQNVRLVLEDENGSQVHNDHPISFEKGRRKFAPRRVRTEFIPKPPIQIAAAAEEEQT